MGRVRRDEVRRRGVVRGDDARVGAVGHPIGGDRARAVRTNFLDGSSLAFTGHVIEDYASTAGAARTWATDSNYGQQGDPLKAAKIIVDLANREDLPERIQLGANAFEDVAAKLARTARDQETWRTISLSADFDG